MGAHKKYEVSLTDVQKEHLEKYIRTGSKKSARKIARARILLSCSEGRTYKQTAESVKVCQMTVFNTVNVLLKADRISLMTANLFPVSRAKLTAKFRQQ
jgi:uncharacterized protein YehS (DUF1456 family)